MHMHEIHGFHLTDDEMEALKEGRFRIWRQWKNEDGKSVRTTLHWDEKVGLMVSQMDPHQVVKVTGEEE